MSNLHDLCARIQSWIFDDALPFWANHGEDERYGGTVEQLGLDGGPSDPGFKRVRVLCRQVYVWSHASLLGYKPGFELAKKHVEVLIASAWQGPEQGWARLLNTDNSIQDGRPDLYDTAFCMFALGWWYRASQDEAALELSLDTLTFVETKMAHPSGGFMNALPMAGPRLQNPHMHLLEACLACFEATGHSRFQATAQSVVNLFLNHFYDPASQTLGEYFDADWNRLTGDLGQIAEPGHQFEWAWILAQAHNLFGCDVLSQAKGLISFGEEFGVDQTSRATLNRVSITGRPIDAGSRTWPNTERVKAAVAGIEHLGLSCQTMLLESVEVLLNRYLAISPKGAWVDAFDQHGKPIATTIPTSTFYHIFLAFAEVLRLSQQKPEAFTGLHATS